MAQGRTFARGEDTGEPGGADISSRGATSLFRTMPDGTDRRLIDIIEQKRGLLRKVSSLERHRVDEFLQIILSDDWDGCQRLVDKVAAECGDPQLVAERLFEPAARVIGESWCSDDCDFFNVTVAISRMQRLFRRMTADFPFGSAPDATRFALLSPAPGEQHTFGLSVVDDAFRRSGWEVDCCGCDEEAEMYRLVSTNHYKVVGLSVSVDRVLAELAPIVQKLRSKSRNRSVVIMAGGSMVMQDPQAAIDAGFDLLAVDAKSAVALAEAAFGSTLIVPNQRMAAE